MITVTDLSDGMRSPVRPHGGSDPAHRLPLKVLLFSVGALAVPVVASVWVPELMGQDVGVLVWMAALLPAFLLAFYKGWRGTSVALAAGMTALSLTQVLLLLLDAGEPDWSLLLGVVTVFVAVSLGLGYFAELLHKERGRAVEQSLTDALTGLPNRRHAEVFLQAAFASAERSRPCTVVLFDLDRFKRVNDVHGHSAGDVTLFIFGRLLKRCTRRMDLSARYGGEEFIAVLADSDLSVAMGFARRVRKAIAEVPFPWGEVTVSAGVAVYQPGMGTPDLLVAAADQALYRAKREGRDRVALAQVHADTRPDPSRRRSSPEPASTLFGEVAGDPGAGASEVEGALTAKEDGPKAIVLLVDDEEAVVMAVSKLLRALGHRVLETTDPERVITLLEDENHGVDLLMVDVVMPRMNGLSLVTRISELGVELPVLYMSGYVHGEVTWPGVPGSWTDFIEKPMSLEELRAKLEPFLAEARDIEASVPGSGLAG